MTPTEGRVVRPAAVPPNTLGVHYWIKQN